MGIKTGTKMESRKVPETGPGMGSQSGPERGPEMDPSVVKKGVPGLDNFRG